MNSQPANIGKFVVFQKKNGGKKLGKEKGEMGQTTTIPILMNNHCHSKPFPLTLNNKKNHPLLKFHFCKAD